ncbi:MAG TPA: phosphate acyltransferase [Chthoniobacteraceae bacterium]|jgi:phosphate acetyltransferase|nr:phosphate acyltransferase [Chthoniobacteraceae bacterium]
MRFIESVFEKLKRHPKRIVFPEGAEPRVLEAAGRFVRMQLGAPILLGDPAEIERKAEQHGIDLERIGILDPSKADDRDIFASRLERLQRYRNIGAGDAREILTNPNYFAAMMIQHGQADALVGGASQYASSLMRPLIQIVKPLPGVTTISSCMMVEGTPERFGSDGMLMFADCAVVPEPTVEQLASIGIETAKVSRQLTGIRPRVAFLSFSTKGSSRLPAASKMAAAAALAKQKADKEKLEMEIDGELQADTALLPDLAALKAPSSRVAGSANVLVFPDLNSGNIAAKLVQHLGGVSTYGQVLLGLSRPAADLSRGASVEDILGVAAIVGLQAIEYRKLYPETDDDQAS